MNIPTIVVGLIVLFAVVAAWKATRKKGSSCGCECSSCHAACDINTNKKTV